VGYRCDRTHIRNPKIFSKARKKILFTVYIALNYQRVCVIPAFYFVEKTLKLSRSLAIQSLLLRVSFWNLYILYGLRVLFSQVSGFRSKHSERLCSCVIERASFLFANNFIFAVYSMGVYCVYIELLLGAGYLLLENKFCSSGKLILATTFGDYTAFTWKILGKNMEMILSTKSYLCVE